MILIENQTDKQIETEILEKIAIKLTTKEIELVFVDNKTIQKLNCEYRGADEPTDVLSFPLEPLPYLPLGSIVISVEYAEQKAKELGHSLNDEMALLFIHGVLHLLGFDHESDCGEMRGREHEIIAEFGLPQSLIERSCK